MYKIHNIEEKKNPAKITFLRDNFEIKKSYYILKQFKTTKTIAKHLKYCNDKCI